MGKRAKEPEKAPNHERWLITYADLITLLMIFFIIMYTISNVNAKKFAQLSSSLSGALVGQSSGYFIGEAPGPLVIPDGKVGEAGKKELEEMEKAQQKLEEYIKEKGLTGKVVITQEERGLVVSLKETLFFPIGSAVINPQARETLSKIGEVLKLLPNHVRIEGHTCNLPIRTALFPSNWELSTARATNVVRFLVENGFDPKKLSATGYGEYRPLNPNTSEANRAMNRRVDIVVLRTVFSIAEPNTLVTPAPPITSTANPVLEADTMESGQVDEEENIPEDEDATETDE